MVLIAFATLSVSWTKLVEFSASEARGVSFNAVGNDAGVFIVQVGETIGQAYRWLSGKITPLPGAYVGTGMPGSPLVTTARLVDADHRVATTYDIRTGCEVSSTSASKRANFVRRGWVLTINDRLNDDLKGSWLPERRVDVRTGATTQDNGLNTLGVGTRGVIQFGGLNGYQPPAPYQGVARRIGPDGKVAATPVRLYDLFIDGIVGSPDGPFAIVYGPTGGSGRDADLISRSFQTLPVRLGEVYDASDEGFLGAMKSKYDAVNGSAPARDFDLLCFDAKTGVRRWRLGKNPWPNPAPRWCGPWVLWYEKDGYDVLDGTTGVSVGTLIPPQNTRYVGNERFLGLDHKTHTVTLWRVSIKRT